ncbi:MAG: hypothetical protein ACD_39C02123G0004 [uncultured bacterium]|nr:MAG: hypothetical protein ACD_39C02123G0004 [uncultured bacterium]
MFTGKVSLGNGTGLDLAIFPLTGTSFPGYWESDNEFFLLCLVAHNRCCICRCNDHPSRFEEKLELPEDDAIRLASWLSKQTIK